jgi:hypothetical protein
MCISVSKNIENVQGINRDGRWWTIERLTILDHSLGVGLNTAQRIR